VISPLLANAVLNKLDWFLHRKGTHDNAQQRATYRREPNVRFVRYADDWCVFVTRASKRYAETLRDRIREFLRRECGLELSVEKTRITHVQDGYDFLGFRLSRAIGQGGKQVPKIKVGSKALSNVKQRLHDAMRNRPHQESVALRLQRGSAVVRGWSEYFRIAHNFTDLAGTLDHHALWIALKAICRKFDIPTGTAMKRFYRNGRIQVDDSCRLDTFSGIPMKLDYRGPEPYRPGQGEYEADSEMDAAFAEFNERKRPGNMDVKYRTLQRDGYRCRACGKPVTGQTSQMDHLDPVKRFASYALASSDDNLQTLCLDCHREKHRA
jgi:RNA-directed DNA polymerase